MSEPQARAAITKRMARTTTASTVRSTLAALRKEAIPERKAFMEGYAPSGERFLGVPVPVLRKKARPIARSLKGADSKDVIAMAHGFVSAGFAEMRQIGYEILELHGAVLDDLTVKDLERLGEGMDNWASVDAFATGVAGRVWNRGRLEDATIKKWARSKNLWWRRAALASTVALNLASRGGAGEVEKTLAICDLLVDDHEEMIVKALSWSLRSVIPHDADAVRAFLGTYESRLAKRVLREVTKKLETGRK